MDEMDKKTFTDACATTPQSPFSWKAQFENANQKAIKAEKKLETLELVVSYARDIVALWPQFSLRNIQYSVYVGQNCRSERSLGVDQQIR